MFHVAVRSSIAAVIACSAPAPIASAQLSAEEESIVASVDSEAARHIDLLEALVNLNSGSLNIAGVTEVGDMVRPEFQALGFDVEWIDMRETERAGHLIATHNGDGTGKRILMIGHLDTVFEPDSPFQTFVRDGDRATGPGIGDDKGGIIVILAALQAMQAAGTLEGADIKVVLTGDEERTGAPASISRRDLVAAGKWADIALGFEGVAVVDGQEYGTIARRSSNGWTLTVKGKTGHSSGIFSASVGYGANFEMARILNAFRTELTEPNLTYNVGVMGGGTPAAIDAQGLAITASGKTNIIAETAIARGGLRALTVEQDARARAKMQAIVALNLPQTSATLEFAETGYPPMAPTAANRALLAELNAASRDLGMEELKEYDPAKRGAADISWVAEDVDAALAGLGADGAGAHAEGESLNLPSISKQAKRMAVFIGRLAREPR
ncbi:MAG: M20/M25/M40 family metallo-hydrolase [Pacificimonas sp.]